MLFPLQFKEGVQLRATQAINEILRAGQVVFARVEAPCIVTAGRDGTHSEHSKHYTDEALDLRIFHLKSDDIQPVVKGLKELLGQDFDVVLEKDHIHVEFDTHGRLKV